MNNGGRLEAGVADATRGSAFLLGLLILCVGAVVAVAAHGFRLLVPVADLGAGWVGSLRVLGSTAVVAGSAWLLAERRRLLAAGVRRPDPTVAGLRTAASIMGVLVLLALLVAPPAGAPDHASRPAPSTPGGGGGIPGGGGPDATSEPEGGFGIGLMSRLRGGIAYRSEPITLVVQRIDRSLGRRMARMLPLILLFVAAAITFLLLVRRRRAGVQEVLPLAPPLAPEKGAAVLVASLGELHAGRDPRGRITAAYYRLLAALAAAGAPRLLQEAPHEYLYRALGPLGVRPEPLHRLTELYVLAQFGVGSVTERHQAAAAEALETSLAGLKEASRPGGGPGRQGPPAVSR